MAKVSQPASDNSKKAKSLFADYPEAKALFFTADGFAWFTEDEARAHAAALKVDTVQTIKR